MRYPTIYADCWPLKDGVGGMFLVLFLLIRPKHREDEGLYRHELEHAKQFWSSLGLFLLLYPLSRSYRMWAEAQAYREQMKWPDKNGNLMTPETGAYRLALPMYRFGLTVAEAREVLVVGDK